MTLNDQSSLLSFLKTRKSASAKALGGPGPTPQQIAEIIEISVRVPDHGKLNPWRFIVFEGEARGKIGAQFADIWAKAHPDHGENILAFQRGFLERAPVVIGVISTAAQHGKIPVWEQQLSAGSAIMNLLTAAHALGFVGGWLTGWPSYSETVRDAFGTAGERIAGFVFLGTPARPLEERPRPNYADVVQEWSK